jgi:hypothetical protein
VASVSLAKVVEEPAEEELEGAPADAPEPELIGEEPDED